MNIFNDFNTSVEKALGEIDPNWKDYKGIIICGTHSPESLSPSSQILLAKIARESGEPFLGICFGHQIAAIEYARNVLGIEDATSEEWGEGTLVVKKRKEGLKVGLHNGETYWNNYEVDYSLVPNFEKDKPPNFITCQFHPEYQSSIISPHPLLKQFIEKCKKHS